MHKYVYVLSLQVIDNEVILSMNFCVSLGLPRRCQEGCARTLQENAHIKGNEEAKISWESHQTVMQVRSQRDGKKVGQKFLCEIAMKSMEGSANTSGSV